MRLVRERQQEYSSTTATAAAVARQLGLAVLLRDGDEVAVEVERLGRHRNVMRR